MTEMGEVTSQNKEAASEYTEDTVDHRGAELLTQMCGWVPPPLLHSPSLSAIPSWK